MPYENIGRIEKSDDPLQERADKWFEEKIESNKPIKELLAELERIVQEERWPVSYLSQRIDSFNQLFEKAVTQNDMEKTNVHSYYEVKRWAGPNGTIEVNVRPSVDSVFVRFTPVEGK